MAFIRDNDIILFQGDSVTDCGRDRSDPACLGHGYPWMIACNLARDHEKMGTTCLNRGVSGDRTLELLDRWDADCINITPKPTVVSIMIGVNDCWHRYRHRMEATSAADFEKRYRELLTRAQKALNPRFILLEPFMVQNDPVMYDWREDLDPKIHAVRLLAREFGARLIPLDGLFAAAAVKDGPDHYAPDGVHPTEAGHRLIAKAWLAVLED